ncbi:hypothetical protein HGRIS_010309 [Hohenbuehelia grisea]|uniref:Uncharacterized protein n=1 Tax=Hohenbuehelia grisea TaxID=104357 RepID=A0ABR3J3X5_9AGAR
MAEVLPTYTAAPATNDLPNYSFPESFRVGTKTTSPFVTDAQLKGHLALLRAFTELKQQVETDETLHQYFTANMPVASDSEDFRERKWTAYVAIAVERFERWYNTLSSSDSQAFTTDHLPPVDVMMVWHAYLLNPGWYAEDCTRLPKGTQLLKLGNALAGALPTFEETYSGEMSRERSQTAWLARTSTAWDPLRAPLELTKKLVTCPDCNRSVETAFLNVEGTGYSQAQFTQLCPCGFKITQEKLGAHKLALDIVRDDGTDRRFLAGTLQSPTSNPIGSIISQNALARAGALKKRILSCNLFDRPKVKGSYPKKSEWIRKILERAGYSLSTIDLKLAPMLKPNLRRHILSAYSNNRIFSVDLVGAVLRQGSFTKKMHDLQWTKPGYFSSSVDAIALQHAIARYHAFMDLMVVPGAFLVPTLDIDLAWHTHQLMATAYGKDCKDVMRKFIDHDDKISEDNLATAYDITCKAWKERFGQAYSHCGCPLPGDSIGKKLQRLIGVQSEHKAPSHLIPPEQPDLLAATHPSDHNAVFPFHHRAEGEAAQRHRRAKNARRQQRAAEQAQRGRASEKDRYIDGHQAAFLTPVPMYYGMYACVAASGHVVNGAGGVGGGGGSSCAAGAGGCAAGGSAACGGSGGGCGGSSGGGWGGGGGGGGGCGGGGGGGGCGGGGG